MKFLYLISTLAVVHCRPQGVTNSDSKEVENVAKVTLLPYYGGAKGQTLKVTETSDGKITMTIIKTPPTPPKQPVKNETTETMEYEFPQLPSKYESEYGSNIKRVHETALNILKLHEIAKINGKLNDKDQAIYNQNINSLSLSAENLARIQDVDDEFELDSNANLSSWLEKKKNKKEDNKKKEENKNKKEEEEEKQTNEEVQEEQEFANEPNDEEAVAINLPPPEASVAEARPIGLAVAGEGGVAASKPIATAVVGPYGLAIARPVGTAIAGVSPDQALVPIYAEGFVGAAKPSRGGSKNHTSTSELLNKIIHKYHQH